MSFEVANRIFVQCRGHHSQHSVESISISFWFFILLLFNTFLLVSFQILGIKHDDVSNLVSFVFAFFISLLNYKSQVFRMQVSRFYIRSILIQIFWYVLASGLCFFLVFLVFQDSFSAFLQISLFFFSV